MTKKKLEAVVEGPGPDNTDLVQTAVAEGRTLIMQGKTKVEASMVIYRQLETLPQETIIAAFIEGASLTEKGALTYWYNCRRRLARERRAGGSSA